jgi:hypothetical protein
MGLGERRYPEVLPRELEVGILRMEVMEHLLESPVYEKKWWEPLRRGLRPELPSAAFVDYLPDGRYNIRYKYERSAPLCFSITAGG